jgi:Cu+-exporting ATPase
VSGSVEGRAVTIGSESYLAERGIGASELSEKAAATRREGATVVLVAIDGAAAALIAVADPIKAGAADALAALKAPGVNVVMLTGDSDRRSGCRRARHRGV